MAGGMDEPLHDRINRKFRGHVFVYLSKCSIFKVPNPLREINEKAYEPRVISIGPYHRGKEHLKAMEEQKMNSLKLFMGRTGESSVEKYVTVLEGMVNEVRKFYSEPLDHIGAEELVEMMLLDGCFIIELIFRHPMEQLFRDFYLRQVMRDLLLVENQLPFAVLVQLYSLSGLQLNNANSITEATTHFFNGIVPAPLSEPFLGWNPGPVKHLLDFLYVRSRSCWNVPRGGPCSAGGPCSSARGPCSAGGLCSARVSRICSRQKWRFIRSATELNEAGIKFQKKEGRLFEIEFQKEVMSVPTLIIDDDTECMFRNLVAYEQCYIGVSSRCFTDYITFMDCLINTGKDVELLCRCGVLDNWLGDNKIVATMFNKLRDSVLISEEDFFYSEIFNKVNEHCNGNWNLWKANLWHNYFNTPWALISFIAAVILLLSTLLQALFSVLSYHH